MIKFISSGTRGSNPPFPIGPFNFEGGGGFANWNTSNWPAEIDGQIDTQSCSVSRETAGAGGAPAARSGASGPYVVKCEMTQACHDAADWATKQHNKFYQISPVNTGTFTGNPVWGPHTIAEGNEKAEYVSWQYFPTDLVFLGTGATGALFSVFFFKHYHYHDGVAVDEVKHAFEVTNKDILEATFAPNTWPNLTDTAHHDRPVLFCSPGNVYDGPSTNHYSNAMYLPLGQWIKFSARVYPGIITELYVNDVLFESYTHDVFKAGIRHKTASSQGGVGYWPELWTFGVGYYGYNVGKLWLGDTYAHPIPEVKPFEPFNPAA